MNYGSKIRLQRLEAPNYQTLHTEGVMKLSSGLRSGVSSLLAIRDSIPLSFWSNSSVKSVIMVRSTKTSCTTGKYSMLHYFSTNLDVCSDNSIGKKCKDNHATLSHSRTLFLAWQWQTFFLLPYHSLILALG